jgi:hypothetical protein
MEKLLGGIGAAVAAILIIAVFAFLGGTIVYWIWPAVMPYMVNEVFGLTAITVAPLLWWKAVLFTWMCGILFKGAGNTSKSSD